jgi:GT2 family glycosyltransferase
MLELFENHKDKIYEELSCIQSQKEQKDILIVVKDQLNYVKNCVQSIKDNTENYNLYFWDNASSEETKEYLRKQNAKIISSRSNFGFIKPNNILAGIGSSPYIILLNSDTVVMKGWDDALITYLKKGYWQVGYSGGVLDNRFYGSKIDFGENVDYIPGWCFAITRELYRKHGLFDERLSFAYGEDSDFSLRLKSYGGKIYALHLGFVRHFENQTIKEVAKTQDVMTSFQNNHEYLRKKWSSFLESKNENL